MSRSALCLLTVVALGLPAATASAQSGSKPTSSGGYVPAAPPLAVGDRATSFNVIDDRGRTGPVTSLAQRGKQTVIVFSRGSFCPYCMAHLTELQAAYDQIKADAELIVVFREESKGTNGIRIARRQTGAAFPIVLDPNGRGSGKRYSVDGYATYVLGTDGVITAILPGEKTNRPAVADILAAIGSDA